MKKVNRRDFLKGLGLTVAAVAVAALPQQKEVPPKEIVAQAPELKEALGWIEEAVSYPHFVSC